MRRATLSAAPLLAACLLSAGLLTAGTAPARAADAPAFSADQRSQIIQIVRDALKADPSILRDAVMALRADTEARDTAEQKNRLAAAAGALTANPADPVAGNPKGDVTLVEFYDPRCPYCRRMLPAIQALLKKDPGLRLVYKDIPVLGPASVLETRAILAAQRQGGYEKMQSALMRNPAQPDEAMIRETARGLGLDPARLVADMNGAAVTHQIDANLALARGLKVEGTPVWIVGEEFIPGAVDEAALEAAVQAARHKG